ncbi:hypothetical protein IIO_04844 [Bacillus cereus VD115]|nr:hypothetical protein IIO_04844 [Bacillus cereus VD115]
MRGPTHVAAGAAFALIAHNYAGRGEDPYLLTATSIIGALILDICHQGSTLGRKIPLLSWGINKTFGHRNTQSNFFVWYYGTSLVSSSPVPLNIYRNVYWGIKSSGVRCTYSKWDSTVISIKNENKVSDIYKNRKHD